jgi:hypothetical protein
VRASSLRSLRRRCWPRWHKAAEGDVVTSLANARLQTSEAAVSRTWASAGCADALGNGNWQLFDVVRDLVDHRRDAALPS